MPALYYIAAFVLAASLLQSAARVSDGERALSRLDTPEERTDTLVKGWMESLSLGLYTGASDKERVRNGIVAAADHERERVVIAAVGIALLSFAFLVWAAAVGRRRGPHARRRLALHLHGVAAVCLVVGLAAPMLTVVAQREVAVLGTVVLQFETKSILGTVRHLLAGGGVFVGTLLALFSVLVPCAKLGVSVVALLARGDAIRHRCARLVRAIGKWSMTDVFVVAVLLAFLASGQGGLTDARLGPGLYFFAAYGLLSLAGGLLLGSAGSPPGDDGVIASA
jgi:hypothetical protein